MTVIVVIVLIHLPLKIHVEIYLKLIVSFMYLKDKEAD